MTQEEFEQLIGVVDETTPLPRVTCVYFTAEWCGACKKLNLNVIESEVPEVNWLKCDVDQNNYTPGYCGVRSIPTFLLIVDKKVAGTLTSNDNTKVISWVKSFLS